MNKIFLAGLPGTGKTTIGTHLDRTRGFSHFDMELNGFALRERYYENKGLFLGRIAAVVSDTVVTWGFGPECDTDAVQHIIGVGYQPVWLGGNPAFSYAVFAECEGHDPGKMQDYYNQMSAIGRTGVASIIGARVVDPFEEDGSFRPVDAVADDVVAAAQVPLLGEGAVAL